MRTVLAILNRSLPLAADFELHIHNAPWPALIVQGIGMGPRGLPAISVSQFRQRGATLLRHPEMRFEAAFLAGEVADLLPFCWRSDYDELEEHSVVRDGAEPDGRPVIHIDEHMLADQRLVARDWDRLLAAQGFEHAYYHAWFLQPQQQAHA